MGRRKNSEDISYRLLVTNLIAINALIQMWGIDKPVLLMDAVVIH